MRMEGTKRSVKHVRAIVLSVLGCVAVAAAGIPPSSAQRPAGEAASGAEEVEATPSLVREIQFMLLRIGIDPGPIDGVVGPQTAGAFRKFEERMGLPVRELANGARVPANVLAQLRGEASRVMFDSTKKPETAPV